MSNALRLALIQLRVVANKQENISQAVAKIRQAASLGAHAVCLPECFNSPYGAQFFNEYAEAVPQGETCSQLSAVAKDCGVWVLGGSIPERHSDGKLYNTHTTFSPDGSLVGTFRKIHLFDIDIPGKITFTESATLSSGSNFFSFALTHPKVNEGKTAVNVGVGICYDVRFPEVAQIYSLQRGCHLLFYPGAFNMTTGPAHWEALGRARALDNQCFVAMCSPARDPKGHYVAYGHSYVMGPWGDVTAKAEDQEAIIMADIDLEEIAQIRESIPIRKQRRTDVYNLAEEK